MTDETLKDLLSDVLIQQENILKIVTATNKKLDSAQVANSKVNEPSNSNEEQINFANNFFRVLNNGLKQLETLSAQIPKEVKVITHQETKIVLFSKKYDEGNYGAKDLLKSLYIFFGICFGLFLLVKYIPSYLGGRDENIAYRDTVNWYYFKSDKKSREALLRTLHQFRKGDTSYINELNRFVENAKILKND